MSQRTLNSAKNKAGTNSPKRATRAPAKKPPRKPTKKVSKAVPPAGTPVPIDPQKLIDEAKRALESKQGRPRSANLRRAVSTAYYALFHSICRQAAEHLLPSASPDHQLRITRAFGHREIKQVCEWIALRTKTNDNLKPLVDHLKTTSVADIAMVFIDLQEARHDADYNHLEPFSQQSTSAAVVDAELAIKVLRGASLQDRELFFALLAIRARTNG